MFSLCLNTRIKIDNARQIFPVKVTFRVGSIKRTDKEAMIEDNETYLEIFKTIKNTTRLNTAHIGATQRK